MAVTVSQKFLKLLRQKILKKKTYFFLSFSVGFATLMFSLALLQIATIPPTEGRVLGKKTKSVSKQKRQVARIEITPTKTLITPTATPMPTPLPTLTPTPTPTPKTEPNPPQTTSPTSQYTAEQIGESTFRINNVNNDSSMASTQEIFDSLNAYRQSRGVGQLSWDGNLSDLAQSRVNTFSSRGDLDSHAGFRDFMSNDGFSKAGFNGLGENSARLSGPMSGERIIKEIFGADAPHDTNQLNSEWTHAAVAISGNFVNVNFGKGKR